MKNGSRKTVREFLKAWIGIAALVAVVYAFLVGQNPPSPKPLAQIGSRKIYREDLPPASLEMIRSIEKSLYTATEKSLKDYAAQDIFKKKAQDQGLTLEKYLDNEVMGRAKPTEAEVQQRYVASPIADYRPYSMALQDIRSALHREKAAELLSRLRDQVLDQEGFRLFLDKPKDFTPGEAPQTVYPVYQVPRAVSLQDGKVAGPPVRGPEEAPVTIEIYSDFLCPFSRRFSAVMKELEQKYPGKVRFAYRQFPLPMHPGADRLAQASACAQEQGKFWEMHDALMAWEGAVEDPRLTEAAVKIGVDPAAFSACLSEKRYADWVNREMIQARRNQVSSTPTLLVNGRLVAGALPTEQFSKLIDWYLNPQGEYPGKMYNPLLRQKMQPAGGQPPVEDKPVELDKAWLDAGPFQGKADAPVTIVEMTDFHCPFCQKGAQVLKPILDATQHPYRLISKQFPLSMHPNAEKAAVAALCAHRQGKYWNYRDELFGASWGKQTAEDFKAAASAVGLDRRKFDACLDGAETLDTVKKDLAAGQAAGVRGTPTFFINGRRVVGANPDLIKKLLEEAAAAAKK